MTRHERSRRFASSPQLDSVLEGVGSWLSPLCIALSLAACSGGETGEMRTERRPFVERHGTELEVGGEPFHFAGSNNYYLIFGSDSMVDDVLSTAQRAGFNTLRTWGFLDIGTPGGSDSVRGPSRGVYLQYWDGSAPAYNDGPDGLVHLDYVIAKAGELGLRLVIPFTNNWNDFGGMDQYVRWRAQSTPDSQTWYHDDFYRDPVIRGWYRGWISQLLERENTLTGVKYKDDPTIAVWELANEPRCESNAAYPRSDHCSTDTLITWADEMSAYVKSIDPKHLTSMGDEGFYCVAGGSHWTEQCGDGVDSRAFAELASMDVMSLHLYPDTWGTDSSWGTQWITRHIEDARAAGKVSLLGEFGLRDQRVRNQVYRQWTRALTSGGGNGGLYWILSGHEDDGSLYGDFDGYTIYADDPVFQTLENFAAVLTTGAADDFAPVADSDAGFLTHDTMAVFEPLANDIAYGAGASALSIDLDPVSVGIQSSVRLGGGSFEALSDGSVSFAPPAGFIGTLELPYQAVDALGRESNVAHLSLTIGPDPVRVASFENGLESWAPLNAMAGALTQSTAYATDGGFGAEVVGSAGTPGNWYGALLDPPLDLSARHAIVYDLQVGPMDGTNSAARILYGNVRCQSPFVWVPQGTTGEVSIDLSTMTCSGGTPDKTQASALYLRFNAGVFDFDNVRIE